MITVEDGTGLADANAFVSVDYVSTYHAGRGNDAWFAAAPSAQEAAIVRATAYLSNSFDWTGLRVKNRGGTGGAQALAWPRSYVTDEDGYAVPNDEVPDEVKQATAEVALRELASPGSMTPDVTPAKQKALVQVGNIRWEHIGGRGADADRPILLIVRDLIGPFVKSRSRLSGRAVRG